MLLIIDRIKFVVIISASLIFDHQTYYDKYPLINARSLIVLGRNDFVYTSSLIMQARFMDP